MSLRNDFASLFEVKSVLSNWIEVSRYISSNRNRVNSSDKIDLCFKNSIELHGVHGYRTVFSLVKYFKRANDLCVFSERDIASLRDVFMDIEDRLQAEFRLEELLNGASGGWVGEKEATLFAIIRRFRPKTVIETGVAQGVSTYVMLKAIALNGFGKLISIDLPNYDPAGYSYKGAERDKVHIPVGKASGWLVPQELRKDWVLKLGPSSKILTTLEPETQVDMFFHDSEHSFENMTFEFEWAYSHISRGRIIVSDDIECNAAYYQFIQRHKDMRPIFRGIKGYLVKT